MDTKILSRLRWACRRGMLELDVLLGNFLEEAWPSLSSKDQAVFTKLLISEDQDLYRWLTGQEVPRDLEFRSMIEMINQHAKTRH